MFASLLRTARRYWSPRRPQPIRRPQRPLAQRRLGFDVLEDRVVPTGMTTFGGLEFMTSGTLAVNVHAVTSSDPVQVGVAPAKGASFVPLLQLDGGVSFANNDPTGTFTTTGTVSGLVGGDTRQLLDAQKHTFTAPGLLGSSYFTLPASDSNMAHLTVGGGQLAVNALHLTASELDLQGTINIAQVASLTVAVQGSDHVVLNANGLSFAGPDPTVAGPDTFTRDGVTLSVSNLDVHVDPATSALDISGTGSVTIGGNTLTLTLGNTSTPGLVIQNGDITSLLATITPPRGSTATPLKVAGLTFALNSATFSLDQAAGTFGIGADATVTLAGHAVNVKLGSAGMPGIVINTSGQLASFDGSLTTDLELGGVTIKAEDLAVHYVPGADLAISGAASFTFAGQTIGLALGSTGADHISHPGIDIDPSTGNLKSLDAAVNTDITVGSVTFKADALGIHYAPGQDFTITGKAEFDLKNDKSSVPDQMVALMFGADGHPGIDIDPNGKLVSLNAAVTTDITIAGLHIKTDGLGIEYQSSDRSIAIYGSAEFALADQSVMITLGDMDHPGLVIAGGQLTSLTASVTADISLLGIHLSANGLTVAYTAPINGNQEMIDIYGSVAVTTSFLTFDSALGTPDNPGLEIVGGQLQKLDITVNGGFSLFGFSVAADGLTINYSAAMNSLELSGGVMVQFTSALQLAASLSTGGLLINTQTGALSLDTAHGLDIMGSVKFGDYGIKDLDIGFSNGPNGVNFHAKGELDLPDNIAVKLNELDIVNGQLADIGITLDAPIEIGDTGFFIDSISGNLENLNNISQLKVMASVEISEGPLIQVPSIPGIFAGGKYALVDAFGSITVSASELDLTGQVSLLGGLLGQGQATIALNWVTGIYSVSGNFSIYDGIITFGGSLTIDNQGDISLLATASVNVPSIIPFIGGTSLGNVNFYLQYRPGQDWAQSYVSAWTSVNLFFTSFTFGFKIDFAGNFSLLNGNDVAAIAAQATVNQPAQNNPYTYACSYTITDPNAASAEVTLSSLDFFDAGYNSGTYADANIGTSGQGAAGGVTSTFYPLSHPGAILPTLSFDVLNSNGTNIGHASFDQAGNFQFTAANPLFFVPYGATVNTLGQVVLYWRNGDPGTTTAISNVHYATSNAVIEVLQSTNSGPPAVVRTYTIDPMGQGPTAASAGGALYSDNISNPVVSQRNATWSTTYTLPHGDPDRTTLSFTLSNGGVVLGSCTVDPLTGAVHFTPKGTASPVPTGGIAHDNVIVLDWSVNPGNATSVSAMYRSVNDRVLNIDLSKDVAPDNTGQPGQYTVEVVTYQPLLNVPMFTETTHYKLPTVTFGAFGPTIKNGVLSGHVYASSYVPGAAQGGPQGSTTDTKISLYYTQTPSTTNGTLMQTLDYGAFLNNGPNSLATGGFSWAGFQNLKAGQYYVYAVINDGQNPQQVSGLIGPFTSTGPTPMLTAPSFLALTPSAAGGLAGVEQGVFSTAAGTALGVSLGYTNPITVDVTVQGGSLVFPAGSLATQFPFTYPSAAAATADLNGLQFVADNTFTNATSLTITASNTLNVTTIVNGVPTTKPVTYTASKTIPLVTPNTHLVVTQSVSSTPPADPDSVTLTVTAANPGGPDGQDGTNVQIQEYLTHGLSYASASASPGTSFDMATGLWTIGSLPVNAPAATLTLTLKADPGTVNTPLSATATGASAPFAYPSSDATSAVAIVPASHALVFAPTTLVSTAVGAAPEWQLTADRGGGGPYTFTLAPGATLPPGLFLLKDGYLSGVPTTAGAYSFAVTAASPSGLSATAPVQLAIAGDPIASAGQPYAYTVGDANLQFFTVTPGSTLPPGLTLSYVNGNYVLGGTPTTAGFYSFSIRNNSFFFGAYQDVPMTLFVDAAIALSPASLPSAAIGSPYSAAITATGGSGSDVFDVFGGTVPPGLVVRTDGTITGTVAPNATPGTYTFNVFAFDAAGTSGMRAYTLQVEPAIAVSPPALPPATVNSPYSVTLTATGGSGTGYTFAVTAGTLPAGLTLAPAGLISGTILAGTLPVDDVITITVTDSNGTTAMQSYTLSVSPAITITPTDLPDAAAGMDFSTTLAATGGSGTGYTFALAAGKLPAGLMLGADGTLSGSIDSAAAAGYYGFTVTATDSQGATGTATCSLFVDAVLTVPTPKLSAATVGVPYSQQLAAAGGSGIYTFAATAGTLPAGLTLSPIGLVSGTIPGTTLAGPYTFTLTVSDSVGGGSSVPVTLTVAAANVTWTGAVSTAWSNPGNWSTHVVPGAGVNVTIPSHPTLGRCPVLDSTATVNNLVLQAGATLTLAGHALTVDGTLTNLGNVLLQGNEAVTLANGNDTREGTWTYVGDGTGGTLPVANLGYFNLTINDGHTHHDTFATTSALNVAGTLTVACGTFAPTASITAGGVALFGTGILDAPAVLNDAGNWSVTGGTFNPDGGTVFLTGTSTTVLTSARPFANLTHSGTGTVNLAGTVLTVAGKLTNAAGTFLANRVPIAAGGIALTGGTFIAPPTLIDTGSWSAAGGTFNANRGTVFLAGTNQHVSGNTTFFNLTKAVTAADTLTFQAGSTQTIGGTLTLKGASATRLLALRSSLAGSTWSIVPNAAAVSFVDVEDSVSQGKKPITATHAHNSGDDTGWKFA